LTDSHSNKNVTIL